MGALTTTETLPLSACARADIVSLIETSVPGSGMVDGVTLKIVSDAVKAANAVPRWTKTVIGFAAVAALGGANGQVTLFTLPDGGVVHAVKVMSTVQWAGGSVSALVGDVGTAGTANKYSSNYNMWAAPATDNYDLEFITGGEEHTVAGTGSGTALKLKVTATGDTLDHLTAGSVSVWVLWSATDV
jgi:hypothetical protein